MTKAYYEDYTNHAMRFYARNPALNLRRPGLKSTDIENWSSCDCAIRAFAEPEQAVILGVYRSKCHMQDAVRAMAGQLNMSENTVWQLLDRFSREFAVRRGLI